MLARPDDLRGYYLGRLCSRGHDHESTGLSRRDRRGSCLACATFYQARYRAARAAAVGQDDDGLPKRTGRPEKRRNSSPATLSICPAPRLRPRQTPCPRVWCRHHLGDVADPGVDMSQSCSLDVADRGAHTLEETAHHLGVTRERARQIETAALVKLRRNAPELAEHTLSAPDPSPRGSKGMGR
jgi:hypothetical protein